MDKVIKFLNWSANGLILMLQVIIGWYLFWFLVGLVKNI